MTVLTYTTYDDVRVALGVSDNELSDEMIEVETVAFELEEQLLAIKPSLIDDFAAIVAIDVDARTTLQQSVYRRTRMFGAAAAALRLSSGLPLFAPKDIGDGKALLSRFSGTPYADVIARVAADYALAYQRLNSTVNGTDTIFTTFPTFFAGVGLSRDPVTSA